MPVTATMIDMDFVGDWLPCTMLKFLPRIFIVKFAVGKFFPEQAGLFSCRSCPILCKCCIISLITWSKGQRPERSAS